MLRRKTTPGTLVKRDFSPDSLRLGARSRLQDWLRCRAPFVLNCTLLACVSVSLTPIAAQERSEGLQLSGSETPESQVKSILLPGETTGLPESPKVAEIQRLLNRTGAAAKKLGNAEKRAGSAGEAELVQQRFSNGRVNVERWVSETADGDFVNHGTYVRYNEAGQVVVSGRYNMGERIGEWTREISAKDVEGLTRQSLQGFKAPFTSKAAFAGGKLAGDWSCSDSTGKLVFVWSFKTGKRNGPSTLFNAKNEVVVSIQYKNDLADGPSRVITAAGRSPEDIEFENGRMLQRVAQYYPASNGSSKKREQAAKKVLKSEDWFLVATPFNVTSHSWEESEVTYLPTEKFAKVRHGRAVTFFPNGQRESEGQYEKGKRTGVFVWWYPNGQQKTVGQYESDKEDGRWDWWHENGMREATGNFASGIKVEQWSVWNPEGRLVKRARADSAASRTAQTPSAGDVR
ncbi:MAG: toxin-antitoxin system YwqK family antitoxin [Pirellulaceae bacterium]